MRAWMLALASCGSSPTTATTPARSTPIAFAPAQSVSTPTQCVVDGEVARVGRTIRPRAILQGGWLALREATVGAVIDDRISLDFKLPRTVIPTAAPLFRMPCSELTFAAPPPLPRDGAYVWLRPASKFPLRLVPEGAVIATIETPALDPSRASYEFDVASLTAMELERAGGAVRMRTGATNYVEGWVDAAMIVPAQRPSM